jgi:hypothetical protein
MHLRLLNAFCAAAVTLNDVLDSELSAQRLHADLFNSGLERILLV